MSFRHHVIFSFSVAFGLFAADLGAAEEKITFNDHVQNALANACAGCHNPDKKKGGLDLTSAAAVLAGGSGGAVAEPGNPGGSRLLKIIKQEMEPKMPPEGPPLDAAAVAIVEKWIAGGMPASKDSKPAAKKSGPDLGFTAKAGKPDGPVAMPEWLPIEAIRTVGRQGPVVALAASPWAPLLAVGGERQIQFIHLADGMPLGVLDFPEGGPYVLRFSSDGRWLLAAGGIGAKSGRVVVFEVTTGRRRMELGRESDVVLAADLSPDLSRFVLGGSSRKVKLYQPGTDDAIGEIKKHTDWLTASSYSPDGVLFATGDRSGGVQVWESDAQAEFHSLRGHEKAITATAWRPDGNLLATASEDGTIRLWDMNSGNQIKSFPAHGNGVLDLSWSQDGRMLSCGRDRKTKIWKSDGGLIKEWVAGEDAITKAVFSHDGQAVITGDFTGKVVVWTVNGERRMEFTPNLPLLAERTKSDQEKLVGAKAEQTKAAEALLALEVARQPLIAQRDQASARVKELEKTISAGSTAVGEKQAAAEKIKGELAASEAEIARLDAEQKATRARIDELNQRAGVLAKEQNDVRALVQTLTQARDAARQTLDKAVAVRDAAPDKPELAEAARLAEQAHAKADADLQPVVAREAALPAEVEAVRAELAALQPKHDAEIAGLAKRQEDLNPLRKSRDEINQAADELSKSIAAADNELKQTRDRITESEKAISAKSKAIAEATAARDQSTARVAAMESRLRRWQAEPVLLEVRSAQKHVWDGESALEQAKAALNEASARIEKETLRRDAARDAVLKGLPMAEARLFLAQSGLNFARRVQTTRTATADRLTNELQSRKAAMEKLKAKFASGSIKSP
ncbi:MAG: c-type cytochrome domain-containing protein [Verrucomicrobiales bacterium]